MTPQRGQIRHCKECDKPFWLTPGMVDFYVQRGLSIPRRCESCRVQRRRAPVRTAPLEASQ